MDLATIAPGLTKRPDGVWVAQNETAISFPASGHDVCFALEDDSYWFRHRSACIVGTVRTWPPPGTIFDIGGGNGVVTHALRVAGFPTVLVEPSPTGIDNARRRGIEPLIQAALEDCGFARGSLPAVGLFDVLEHIEEADAFLELVGGMLQPGGRIYMTVPALPWLWSADDAHAGHFRRYTASSLTHSLTAAGFQIRFLSYLFLGLVPAVFAMRTVPSWLGISDPLNAERAASHHGSPGGVGESVLKRYLRWERSVLHSRSLPIGSSLIAVAETTS